MTGSITVEAAAERLKAAERVGFQSKWMAPFFTADPTTRKLAGDLLNGTYFSSWLMPVGADDPEIKAYREQVPKLYPNDPVGVFGLNGWSNGALFVKGFKMLLDSGKPLTRANLVDVMETMTNATIGGARNAGLLAVRILAASDPKLRARMESFQEDLEALVLEKDRALREQLLGE